MSPNVQHLYFQSPSQSPASTLFSGVFDDQDPKFEHFGSGAQNRVCRRTVVELDHFVVGELLLAFGR